MKISSYILGVVYGNAFECYYGEPWTAGMIFDQYSSLFTLSMNTWNNNNKELHTAINLKTHHTVQKISLYKTHMGCYLHQIGLKKKET